MVDALTDFSLRRAVNPGRHVQPIDRGELGFMVAETRTRGWLGLKIASVFPENASIGLDRHQGIVVLLNPYTGAVKHALDASLVTALRTAAVSAAVTNVLARTEAKHLGLIGCGRQAEAHVDAIVRIRAIQQVSVYGRNSKRSQELARRIMSRHKIPAQCLMTAEQVAQCSDILVTATSSDVPLINESHFKPGAHINAIGACRPHLHEIQLTPKTHARIFVDSISECKRESIELDGVKIVGEVGALFAGHLLGRTSANQVTLFKSVGLAVEDVYAAEFLTHNLNGTKKAAGRCITEN